MESENICDLALFTFALVFFLICYLEMSKIQSEKAWLKVQSTKKSLASGCVWIHWRCSPRSPGILAAIRAEKGKLEGKGRVKRGRKGKGALPLRFIVLEPPLLKVLCWSCMIWHIDKDWNLQCRFYFPWHTLKKLQENCTRNLHWYTWRESCSLIFQLCLKCKKLAPNGVAFWYKFPAQVSWACVTPL